MKREQSRKYEVIYMRRNENIIYSLIVLLISLMFIVLFKFNTQSATYENIATPTEYEYMEVSKVIAGESQNDSYNARIAVVEVIMNRCLDPRFPDTPYEVVSQKGQFSIWRIRDAGWIEPSYGMGIFSTVLESRQETVLPSTEYVVFSTRKQRYGYDYIKIGKTWFGKMR